MSEEVKTEEEPSIEEILDSIRQIISEDEEMEESDDASPAEADEADEAQPEPNAEPEVEAVPMDQSAIDDMDFDAPALEPNAEPESMEEDEDVLELTDLLNPEENAIDIDMVEGDDIEDPEPIMQPAAMSEPEPIVEPVAMPEPKPIVESVAMPEPQPQPQPEPQSEPDADGDALFTKAAEAAAVSAMSNLVRKTAVGSSITLEDIVRAELKPLLRDWLDKHLPIVIERLVKAELERVSKRVLDE
jgi:hypothetical protein